MTAISISNAFDQYLQTNIASIPGAILANMIFNGATYVPEASTPFIFAFQAVFQGKMITTGTLGIYQWDGVYQVNSNFPLGLGKQEVLTQMDAIRALFPNGLTITTSDNLFIKIFAPSMRPVLTAGAWITGPVRIPWMLHEVSA